MSASLEDLERRIVAIEQRNARVEKDKAWETSSLRILVIGVLTYIVAVMAFWILGNEHFLLNALVPSAAFVLSVQSLPVVRRWWMKCKK